MSKISRKKRVVPRIGVWYTKTEPNKKRKDKSRKVKHKVHSLDE